MKRKTILAAEGLAYSYRNKVVLSDISLTLDAGQVAVLFGRNGSGKTTLLRCLSGWIQRKSGSQYLCGEPFDGSNQEQRGLLFFVNDTPAFYDDLTAMEHIDFLLSLNGKTERRSVAIELLQEFDLFGHRDQLPSSYSRGMRMKLALCIAFTLRPPLILLDEPFGPLDAEAAALLCQTLREAAEEGSAVLLSLHHQVPGLRPDSVWTLNRGRLHASHEQPDIRHDVAPYG